MRDQHGCEYQAFQLGTPDDWGPNHPGNTVQVMLLQLGNGQWRVGVWGAGDRGLVRDHNCASAAQSVYRHLAAWRSVRQQDLRSLGFIEG